MTFANNRHVLILVATCVLPGCLADVELPPKAPTLLQVPAQTTVPALKLRGTRLARTEVLLGTEVIVPLGDDTSFEFNVVLVPGDNTFELWSRRPSGLKSTKPATVTINYEPACPDAPVLTSTPPTRTNQQSVTVSGTKPAGTAVVLGSTEVVPADTSTTWMWALSLPPAEGTYAFSFTTRDAKQHTSEPVRFSVTYDVSRPTLAGRYPTAATDTVVVNTGIPTNAQVFVVFAEAMRSSFPPDAITVTAGGNPVAGTILPHPAANTLVWTPNAAMAQSVVHTVTVNAAALADLAGNAPLAGATWSWTFTTGPGVDMTAPAAPSGMGPATSPAADVVLSGMRDAWTSIWVNGEMVLAPGPAVWMATVALPIVGENQLELAARSVTNQPMMGNRVTVTRTQLRPAAPRVDSSVPTTVSTSTMVLTGTKPAGASLFINGVLVVCQNAETTWTTVVTLAPGINNLTLVTRDAQGDSDPTTFTVDYAQTYSGEVPSSWVLKVGFTLKDFTGTRIANEFITGNNNYGVDVWVEGPIALGETCEWDATRKQRKNIKYVGTLEHYLGVKTGHTVPFADDDYRGADYLAALAAGGVLTQRGINPNTQRRDMNGREDTTLMAGVTEGQLRQMIDCFGYPGIDGCSQATVNTMTHQVDVWEPRTPPDALAVPQGDYLLWVQFNLDRSSTWLFTNDTETCWDNPADFDRGMHRVVKHVSLGATPWSVTYTTADELSAPDPDGTGNARFLAPGGLTVSWGPR